VNGFAERLERAMGERDITPGELARRVGVVKGAVSGWLSNKRPSRKNMQQLAEVLGVSAAWLEHGEGEGPKGGSDTADERASLFWWLRKQSPDGQRVLGEAASSSFDPKLDTIAREAAQTHPGRATPRGADCDGQLRSRAASRRCPGHFSRSHAFRRAPTAP